MNDYTFGGNFNRLKNLAVANGGTYYVPSVRSFDEKGVADVAALIADAAYLYLEGYLWDPEEPRAAMRAAMSRVAIRPEPQAGSRIGPPTPLSRSIRSRNSAAPAATVAIRATAFRDTVEEGTATGLFIPALSNRAAAASIAVPAAFGTR